MSAAAKIPVWMSVAEFMLWRPGGEQRWQLVDGEPQAMAPASARHGAIQNEVGALLRNHLLDRGAPCQVVTTPGIVPHVQASHNVRIPDLAVTCTPDEDDTGVLGAPVLVIEILSPSNRAETWANVWTYTTIPSVTEILVLHAAEIRADLLRRAADGSWPETPQAITEGDLRLDRIGFHAPLRALYRTTRLAG